MCRVFCYLIDTLGGTDLAATDTCKIRNGWMMFRELFPFLTQHDLWK